jgi:hypothetical protein
MNLYDDHPSSASNATVFSSTSLNAFPTDFISAVSDENYSKCSHALFCKYENASPKMTLPFDFSWQKERLSAIPDKHVCSFRQKLYWAAPR